MYTVDYFIKKFKAIPEGRFLTGERHDGKGNHCAHGWCDLRNVINESGETMEEMALSKLAELIPGRFGFGPINNGTDYRYQQPTPKQRILAALYDIKAMQQPVHQDITASLAVLPVSETSDLITKPVLS